MKVSELIERLKHMDQDLPVYTSHEYGDHWGSVVAHKICDIEEIELVYSAYHQSMRIPACNDDGEVYADEYAEKPPVTAVVLS